MTIVEGQIESLKKLREVLLQNGITRFGSIGDINNFLENFESEKNDISKQVEHEIDVETKGLQEDLARQKQSYEELKDQSTAALNSEIGYLREKLHLIEGLKNGIRKFLLSPKATILKSKISSREKNFERIIRNKTYAAEKRVTTTKERLDDLLGNKESIVLKRSAPRREKLNLTKQVVEGLYTLIAGAIGENLVVKELQQLPDKYVLFNDYSLALNPPIYNKNENDRIYSIQVDHLLVSNAGIFVLETKNWSKKSVASLDLRSPVEQIKRTSFALFVLLNSDSGHGGMHLDYHHWGEKKIPIRNVIVMIHEKPKEEFKFVKVVTLKELNGYISYFDAVFSDEEVKVIADYLRMDHKGSW